MILDKQLLLSDAQAVTAAAASDNILDLSEARDIGVGKDLFLVSVCDVAMTDAHSAHTLAVTLETHEDTAFSTGTVSSAMYTFPATSAIGTVKYAKISPDQLNEQYARVYYTPADGDLTAGSFTTFITTDITKYAHYADAVTIQ